MCVCPIKVRNPRLNGGTFIQGVDKEYLLVPCGHCPECNNKRMKDLVFRMYFEYLECKSHGGFALFNTLTYSDVNLPVNQGMKYFKKKDLQKFLKRLRMRLERDGYDVKGNLSYVITSEFGTKRRRPHYHVQFFVKFKITSIVFDSYVRDAWVHLSDRFSDNTPLGVTDARNVQLRIVNSVHALQYIAKYIFKGTSVVDAVKYHGWSDFGHYVNKFCFDKSNPVKFSYKELQDWQINIIWKVYKAMRPELDELDLMPFYLSSKGLGMSFLENCCYEDLFDVVMVENMSKRGYSNYSLPMYYVRKVFYNYDKESKRYILNDYGKEYKLHVNSKLKDDYNIQFDANMSVYNNIFLKLYPSEKSIYDYVDKCLHGHSRNFFIKYCLYLKDRQISPLHKWLIPQNTNDLEKYIDEFTDVIELDNIEQTILDNPKFYYRLPKSSLFNDDYEFRLSLNNKYFSGSQPLYNSLPCFIDFDKLYDCLDSVKREFNKANALKITDEINKRRYQSIAASQFTDYACIIV